MTEATLLVHSRSGPPLVIVDDKENVLLEVEDSSMPSHAPVPNPTVGPRECSGDPSTGILPGRPEHLVPAEFDLDVGQIRFYALRRKEPTFQPMLREIDHRLPKHRFRE